MEWFKTNSSSGIEIRLRLRRSGRRTLFVSRKENAKTDHTWKRNDNQYTDVETR